MLTGRENKEDLTQALEAGADDFVGKSSDIAVLKGRIRALLAALEEAGVVDLHAWPRAVEVEAETGAGAEQARYAIGLGRGGLDAERLAGIAEHWGRGLAGVTLAWVEGGAVPTLR